METILAASVSIGGTISILKLAVFLLLFFLWLPLVNWAHTDAQAVRTNVRLWSSILAGVGAGGLILLLLIPNFLIGLVVYVIGLGAASMAYTIHRNSLVADFEKILTFQHLKGLLVNETRKMEKASRGLSLVTANGNDVPYPDPKSPEAFGFGFTCEVLEDALWRRAAEVHFQPGAEEYSVTYLIDGVPEKQEGRSREEMEYLIHYLKQLGDLDVKERRKPQTSSFKVIQDEQSTEWEITTAGSTVGEYLKLRKMQEYAAMKLPDLGLYPDQVEALTALREQKQGLFIISGPKKSGVTTTFYAMLRNHDPFLNNINTLENQPAAELQNITQNIFTLTDTGTTTYAKKLQYILRMGPDIMGISDCESKQTAFLATKAATDGKLVHMGMEAQSVMQALGKLLKYVEDKNLVADALIGLSNQRLVRKLCDECKQAYQPNAELLRKFNLPADKIKVMYRPGEVEYDKHGKPIVCEKCQGTGYFGRVGIYETVMLNDELRDVIRKAGSLQDIANQFRRAGMLYMQEQSIKKVAQGVTSVNEVIREFTPPQKKSGGQKA